MTLDAAQTAAKLSQAQKHALDWLYPAHRGRPQWRAYNSPICGDPSLAALLALVRRDLAQKQGGNGFPSKYQPTEFGLEVKDHVNLREKNHVS
jgi:hypothetical protein